MTCDNKDKINQLYSDLTDDYESHFPDIDWNDPAFQIPQALLDKILGDHKAVHINDVTVKRFDGTGDFDVLMASTSAHLREEFKANRITGGDYARAWVNMFESTMQQAVAFTLSKDDAKWKAITAQLQAITAIANLKLAQAQIAAMHLEEDLKKAQYGLTKAQIVTEELNQCRIVEETQNVVKQRDQIVAQTENIGSDTAIKEYQLDNILPKELALLTAQVNIAVKELDLKEYELSHKMPAEVALMGAQKSNTEAQTAQTTYTTNNALPEQVKLVKEQVETERANTMDTRSDGTTPVTGSVGKQKDLYTQQIDSYQRDSELKAAKVWADAWSVVTTITEDTEFLPTTFQNPTVNSVMELLKTKAGLANPGP